MFSYLVYPYLRLGERWLWGTISIVAPAGGAYGAALELPKFTFKGLAQAGSLRQGRFDEPHENKAIGLGYDYLKIKIDYQGSNNYKHSYKR